MGGNALKNVKTVRIDPDNYQRIKTIIMEQLKLIGWVVSDIREVPVKSLMATWTYFIGGTLKYRRC
jgi:hypothetical protein